MSDTIYTQLEQRAGGIDAAMKMVGVSSVAGWYEWRGGKRQPSQQASRLIQLYLAMSDKQFDHERKKYCE